MVSPTGSNKEDGEGKPKSRSGSAASRPVSGRTGSRASGRGSRSSGRPSSEHYDEGTIPQSDMDYTAEGIRNRTN